MGGEVIFSTGSSAYVASVKVRRLRSIGGAGLEFDRWSLSCAVTMCEQGRGNLPSSLPGPVVHWCSQQWTTWLTRWVCVRTRIDFSWQGSGDWSCPLEVVAGGVQGQLSSGRKMKHFSRMILLNSFRFRVQNNPPPRFMFGEASWNPWCCPSCTMVAGLWGISMDIEQSVSSGWQVLCPRSSSTHPHVCLLTSQLFAKVGCFGLAGMCASMVWSCGLLARREKQRKVLPLHRFYYSHAICLAMSFLHTCASTTTLTVPCRTRYH